MSCYIDWLTGCIYGDGIIYSFILIGYTIHAASGIKCFYSHICIYYVGGIISFYHVCTDYISDWGDNYQYLFICFLGLRVAHLNGFIIISILEHPFGKIPVQTGLLKTSIGREYSRACISLANWNISVALCHTKVSL